MEEGLKKKVQLVLSGGGARGIAHIAVIEALEERGYEIIEVVGCSMGAVVGGLYACGDLPSYRDWLKKLNRGDIFRLIDLTLARHGFVKGEKVFNTILEMTGQHRIEDLPLPFAAVATDLHTGEEVVFRQGDLFQALRASISIPGIFTPVRYEGKLLVDGGVINPLPLNLVQKRHDATLVAVDINAPEHPKAGPSDKREKEERSWLGLNWPWGKNDEQHPSEEQNLVNVLQLSYDHMQNRLIRLSEQTYPPDVLIQVPRNVCGMFDFFKAEKVLAAGREAFAKIEDQLPT